MKKILIMGLPGSGKTSLAELLVPRLAAVHFNADAIRGNINLDLGFSLEDRIEQARRMGWLCDQVVKAGGYAVADFICPTPACRVAFGDAFVVWIDRIKRSVYPDTDKLFVPPTADEHHLRLEMGTLQRWVELVADAVRPVFDWKKPTALFIGRYQPFHAGHRAIIVEGLRRVGQVAIAVRDTGGTSPENPLSVEAVIARIENAMRAHEGRFVAFRVPNIAKVFYGRKVGYDIERIDVDGHAEVSGTDLRARAGL